MISISNKTLSLVTKITIGILILYSIAFLSYRAVNYFKTTFEKQKIQQELQLKKDEVESVIKQTQFNKNRLVQLNKSYMTKDEIAVKIKDIFKRMSVFDYELNYLDSKKMCIDRHILIVQVNSQSQNGQKAAEGILSFIGNTKKSDKSDKIYFVDYVSKIKE